MNPNNPTIINEAKIGNALKSGIEDAKDPNRIRAILQKARELKGLSIEETSALLHVDDSNKDVNAAIFEAACHVKENIYGKRVVIFAPLYIANLCQNNCLYCAFRAANTNLNRRYLTQEEIARETEVLIDQGHKRLVLLAGEAYPEDNLSYVFDSIATVYQAKNSRGDSIRRLNINIAPLDVEEFKELKNCGIGTYQLFQETYDRDIYSRVHLGGKKRDYDWRVTTMDRAMAGGIDDVGLGVLFGLADWRFEVLALLEHAAHLEKHFGAGPHTISVPRLEPALGSALSNKPLHPVSDQDFCKLVAVLRLAVPYTGIIMSTRETPALRRATLDFGVSQISAGSCTGPGGYVKHQQSEQININSDDSSQFSLGDQRPLDEVVRDIVKIGYFPSFCTACYRLERTGKDFMCLAKDGRIKNMCLPNALLTLQEYLLDYASPETRIEGEALIERELAKMSSSAQCTKIRQMLSSLRSGSARDVLV